MVTPVTYFSVTVVAVTLVFPVSLLHPQPHWESQFTTVVAVTAEHTPLIPKVLYPILPSSFILNPKALLTISMFLSFCCVVTSVIPVKQQQPPL